MSRSLHTILFFLLAMVFSSQNLLADSDEFNQFKLDLIMAKRGDLDAQYSIASAYEEGRGAKKDLAEAFRWYKTAAAKGHMAAQYKLGYFYENGLYVKKDKRSARSWYELAAMNGDKLAKARLAELKKPSATKPAVRKTPQTSKTQAHEKRKLADQKARQEQARKNREAQARRDRQRQKKEAKARQERQRKQAEARKRASQAKKTAPPSYDVASLIKAIKQTKWKGRSATDTILPSAKTHCLISGGKDIICFSSEQKAGHENAVVTYTSKSTLSGFKTNGHFRIEYMFNVSDISPGDHAGKVPPGLRKVAGWQDPPQQMYCQALSLSRLSCIRDGERFDFSR